MTAKDRKDAFYFYRANWNPEPMVYIAGRRNTLRQRPVTDVTVFSNCGAVTLTVNGRTVGVAEPDEVNVCRFRNVELNEGTNTIKAHAGEVADECRWML